MEQEVLIPTITTLVVFVFVVGLITVFKVIL